MEVTVIKFERHLEMSKVSVTFSIKKVDTGFATTMAGLVDMQGTDDEMVTSAWNIIQNSVKYWLTTEKKIVGSTFTVPVPEPEVVTVPEPEVVTIPEPEVVTVPEPEVVTVPEVSLSSSN